MYLSSEMSLEQSNDKGKKDLKKKVNIQPCSGWGKKENVGFCYKVIECQKSKAELPQDGRSKNMDKSSSKIKCSNLVTLVFRK